MGKLYSKLKRNYCKCRVNGDVHTGLLTLKWYIIHKFTKNPWHSLEKSFTLSMLHSICMGLNAVIIAKTALICILSYQITLHTVNMIVLCEQIIIIIIINVKNVIKKRCDANART